jgi:UDP-N-acetylglucosamine 1-carboxyvinyltransferase
MDKLIIEGGTPLRGEVEISGSKNAALPIIVATILLDSPSFIKNVPNLQDVRFMIQMLQYLGIKTTYEDNVLTINPSGFKDVEVPYEIVRKMRASIYVLGPLLTKHGHAKVSLPGGCAIGIRPVDLHLGGMEALGAEVEVDHGCIEATVPRKLKGGECQLVGENGPSVGATCNVLMAAVCAEGETVIHGAAIEPEIGDLVEFLQKAGAIIDGKNTNTLRIQGQPSLQGVEHEILPDRIETGTFMAAAMITQGDVLIRKTRPDHLKREIAKLREIGSEVEIGDDTLRVRHSGDFASISIRTLPYPGFATDLQAQFMAVLALAKGESTITETIFPERFIHVAELNRMGAKISVAHATSIIRGVEKLTGAHVMATDLRASAALAVAGLAAVGITDIHRIYHLDRGYENIEAKLNKLGAKIRRAHDV